ncbi:MAG: DNA polymerase domain-containing protein [Gaiellaceae bacterium]
MPRLLRSVQTCPCCSRQGEQCEPRLEPVRAAKSGIGLDGEAGGIESRRGHPRLRLGSAARERGRFYFQKDAPKGMPEWIERFPYPATSRDTRETRMIDYPVVNDELALLWMVNMGCIDLNTWYSRVDSPHRPDWVLFDLDPSEGVGFAEAVEVALLVKQALDAFGLVSFPKTSGSRGMHVLVPIERRSTYDDTRRFSAIVAGAIARAHPDLVTTQWVKSKRRGVLIDANQNGEGKTVATVYSVRPRAGAPVSTPLSWDEVNAGLDPAAFTMDEVLRRVGEHGDLFAGS